MPNPHFVGGSRALVKPCGEKSKLPNRRFAEDPFYYSQAQPYSDMDSESLSTSSVLEAAGYVQGVDKRLLMEVQLTRNAELPLDSSTEHTPVVT